MAQGHTGLKVHSDAVTTAEAARWHEVLDRCGDHDVYHLPEYHQHAEQRGEGRAVLLACDDGSQVVAMPFLLRELDGLEGIPAVGARDATSVYGYAGPIASDLAPPEPLRQAFAHCLREYLAQERAVAAFGRLHPLLDGQAQWLEFAGEVVDLGATIAIDLRLPSDEQYRIYRRCHKHDIERARQVGMVCIHDQEWKHLEDFSRIYLETMRRLRANSYYFFDQRYFAQLHELLGDKAQLFAVLRDGKVICGGLFFVCGPIVQAHLVGTETAYLPLAPMKLLFDTARQWANGIGAHFLHLGGGTGAGDDSLLHFKAGFSKCRFQYRVWRLVADPPLYGQLVEAKSAWDAAHGLETADENYFPLYRAPVRPSRAKPEEREPEPAPGAPVVAGELIDV